MTLWGVFLAVATALFLARSAAVRREREQLLDSSSPALTAEGAKSSRLFWVQDVGAIRLLQDPALFEDVFPGYGEARTDAGLWRRYFTEPFDQTVYSATLKKAISTSSFGALDIFRGYGADILLIGISDTFIPVPAGLLRDGLERAGLKGKKILQCGRGNLLPDVVAWYARAITGREKKIPLVVWGYSLHYARREPTRELVRGDLLALYKRWRAENMIARFDRSFPHPSWDLFIGPGLQKEREREDEGVLIPDAVKADPRLLTAFLEKNDDGRYLVRRDAGDCDMTGASREADLALVQLLRVADKVLIFLPPTAPLNRRQGPACLLPSVAAMLRSKSGDRVFVETGDWDAYGLSYRDYLYASREAGMWKIDPIHANPGGAVKITKRLAGIIAAARWPESKIHKIH